MSKGSNQIYDGYKPVVCQLYPEANRMALLRNNEFIGFVRVNQEPDINYSLRMFDLLDVIINLQIERINLSMNDLEIIREGWNKMQEMRAQNIPNV